MTEKIDLSGVWSLELDKNKEGKTPPFSDTIMLPGTTSCAQKGEINTACETGFLTDTYLFEGWAWFSREVDFTPAAGKNAFLFFERTRVTTLYIDGKEIGSRESLVSPHVYDITNYAAPGAHTVTVKVSNVDYKTKGGHMTSPDTQTNWNGITGRIELLIFNSAYLENVFVKSDVSQKAFRITADVIGAESGEISVFAEGFDSPVVKNTHNAERAEFKFDNSRIDIIYHLGAEAKLWSEWEPNLYSLKIDLNGDIFETVAGLREFKASGDKFLINGKKTFLRGKHDGMIFPLTGFAPTDVGEWLRVMGISKDYGMNHYRYHTCCPPEAAFLAADILGIYMEPELPFWGTVTAKDDENHNEEEQQFLIDEGFNMLRAFGNHPSYCMMSMGNELWGSAERINEILGGYKAFDDRHLYTGGSNNFQFFPTVLENDDFFCGVRLSKDRLIRGSYGMCDAPLGHVQAARPSTMTCYDDLIRPKDSGSKSVETLGDGTVQIQYGTTMKTVKASEADADFIPEVPIVTHEIGQYETYPNFDEIEKYTGSIKAKNFEIFKRRLEKAGLGKYAKDYFYSSGRLAMACYKEEMEAVFRSRLLAGFQILDIQDFSGQGTALVGVLDAFMDNKGIITDREWRMFCSDAVLLGEFEKYVYEAGEEFKAHVMMSYYRNESVDQKTLLWELKCSCGKTVAGSKALISQKNDENYLDICDISARLPETDAPASVTLSLKIEGTDIENSYTLWVYPKTESVDIDGAYLFESADDPNASRLLDEGKNVLIIPRLENIKNSVDGFYCQDFWCYPMFRSISEMMNKPVPVGTMGLLIDNEHPALKAFPSEKFSTEQWWDIVENSKSEILDDCYEDKNIIVRTIDNFERNHQLALLYEYKKSNGKVIVCNCDFEKLAQTPNGRQFIISVIEYAKN